MNIYTYPIRRSYDYLFQRKFLVFLLLLAMPFTLQASEQHRGWSAWLYGSIAAYFGSKSIELQDQRVDKTIELTTHEVVIYDNPSLQEEHKENEEGKKLVSLYRKNYKLSSKVLGEVIIQLPSEQRYDPQLCWHEHSFIQQVVRSGRYLTGFCSMITPYKLLTAMTVTMTMLYLPVAQAAKLSSIEPEDNGAIACAVCIAGCCAMLGIPNGALCIVYCATNPCAALCAAPTP